MNEPEIVTNLRNWINEFGSIYGVSFYKLPRQIIVSEKTRNEVQEYNEWWDEQNYGYIRTVIDKEGNELVFAKGIELIIGYIYSEKTPT